MPALQRLPHGRLVTLQDVIAEFQSLRLTPLVVPVEFRLGGTGSVLTTGSKGFTRAWFTGAIYKWTLIADQIGSVSMDLRVCHSPSFPVAGDSIVGSAPLSLSSQRFAENSTLTDWKPVVSYGDLIEWRINSVSTITQLYVLLEAYA